MRNEMPAKCFKDIGFGSPARICKKGEEPIPEELKMIPIEYLTPFCHNTAMEPTYSFQDKNMDVFIHFRCQECGHDEVRLVAVSGKRGRKALRYVSS